MVVPAERMPNASGAAAIYRSWEHDSFFPRRPRNGSGLFPCLAQHIRKERIA